MIRLVAGGYSNAQVGRALFLRAPAVNTHETRVRAKLQLRDRVQAVILASETGFVRREVAGVSET